jgi:hypothetical protein
LYGGGVYAESGASLTLTNSTISGNRAARAGGGIYSYGANVYLSNNTIVHNIADSDQSGGETGGGIARDPANGGNIIMRSSILAGNTRGDGTADDCAAVLSSQGANLIQNTTGCTIGGTTNTNIYGQDPKLSPLLKLGGATRTHGLYAFSPALDQINEPFCVDVFGNGIGRDQRGQQRSPISNTGIYCDIGAFEGTTDVIFADDLEY